MVPSGQVILSQWVIRNLMLINQRRVWQDFRIGCLQMRRNLCLDFRWYNIPILRYLFILVYLALRWFNEFPLVFKVFYLDNKSWKGYIFANERQENLKQLRGCIPILYAYRLIRTQSWRGCLPRVPGWGRGYDLQYCNYRRGGGGGGWWRSLQPADPSGAGWQPPEDELTLGSAAGQVRMKGLLRSFRGSIFWPECMNVVVFLWKVSVSLTSMIVAGHAAVSQIKEWLKKNSPTTPTL